MNKPDDHCRADIADRLTLFYKKYHIADIVYCIDLADHKAWFSHYSSKTIVHQKIAGRKHIYASSANALTYWRCWGRRWIVKDRNFEKVLENSLHIWEYDCDMKDKSSPLIDMIKFGYRHRITFSIPCPFSPELVARFSLLIDSDMVKNELLNNRYTLVAELEYLHMKIARVHGKEINPLVDFNIVKPLSRNILSLLSDGYSRAEIAESCHLTERGIDYHIDVLKKTLAARNIANLIKLANTHYLI
ncbi:LuxR C-terminal-related transcriptional regulator [Shewanella benthica]|uniref:Transcriptional regulator, LuxR family protein n=1 Tax=Shewanella benthica KT99 TaxID=314608 RepID=A9DDU5_9GAMM|nr:LuxR C-terminal-related transcriptional regulator [Shewanella benthica]EDQ00173.1 transcriptional regulator, LuxR family protein [Shewanella benthica KT99]